jgi:hypothetical protein
MQQTTSKQHFTAVIVIPIGPNEPLEYALDTVASVQHYLGESQKIVIDDNSAKCSGEIIKTHFPRIDIVKGDYSGMWSKLYCNIGKAITHACDHYTFDVMLRMDADALVIGPRPELDAVEYFTKHPDVGIAGGYEYNYEGKYVYDGLLGWWPMNASITYQAFNPLSFLFPSWPGYTFRKVVQEAVRNNYTIGHQINGGAYFMQYECAMRLWKSGYLTHPMLSHPRLTEDIMISVVTSAVGMKLGNLSLGDAPFALEWGGMPAHPKELVERKKKITHSVKRWEDMTQPQIRKFFAELRGQTFPLVDFSPAQITALSVQAMHS